MERFKGYVILGVFLYFITNSLFAGVLSGKDIEHFNDSLSKRKYKYLVEQINKLDNTLENFEEAKIIKAKAMIGLKKFTEAEKEFNDILRSDKNNFKALIGKARLNLIKENMSEVVKIIKYLDSKFSSEAAVKLLKADFSLKNNDLDGAIDNYLKTINIDSCDKCAKAGIMSMVIKEHVVDPWSEDSTYISEKFL